MTTGGAESAFVDAPVFVDTNLLVYAAVSAAPRYEDAHTAPRQLRESGAEIWLSRQVLREYLAALSRPQTFTRPLPVEELVADIRRFESGFRIAEDGAAVTERLLELLRRYPTGGRQVHDANIVATMLAHRIPVLLTANPADFARFAGLISVVPLEARP